MKINQKKKLKKKAIALLCRTPHEEHINFLKELTRYYDIYFVYDNEILASNLPKIDNIYYIYYHDQFVADKGYTNALFYLGKKKTDYGLISSWDKAFYYFCEINTKYNNIWFIEDDVFIPLKNTLINIDKKYSSKYDLLVANNIKSEDGDLIKWNVPTWTIKKNYLLPLPWFRSMVCATRISKQLLLKVKDLTKQEDTLVFHEYMLNTLAYMNNLKVKIVPELMNIKYRHNKEKNYNYDEIEFDKLYHPMKDMKLQKIYHEIIKKKYDLERSIQTHQ